MKKPAVSCATLFFLLVSAFGWASENGPVTKANYELPGRFTPNKMKKMVYSTSVDAHWLKFSDRFWYIFETCEG